MSDDRHITQPEREALDQLGRNFDALLARTPEQERRADRRRYMLAGAAVAVGMLALIVWASWPGDSTVDSALGGIADVAAQQTAPDSKQFVESESTVTNLSEAEGAFSTSTVNQRAWLSMARPGVTESRIYVQSAGGAKKMTNVLRSNPMPVYRIAGSVYRPAQITAFADDPAQLIADIDDKVAEVAPKFRPETKWKYLIDPLKAIAPPLPSSLRAALIRELESLPGVKDAVERPDPRGRDGLALELKTGGLTLGVIFDADDAQVLYTDSVIETPGESPYPNAKAGTKTASYLLLSSRVVDSAPRIVSKSK